MDSIIMMFKQEQQQHRSQLFDDSETDLAFGVEAINDIYADTVEVQQIDWVQHESVDEGHVGEENVSRPANGTPKAWVEEVASDSKVVLAENAFDHVADKMFDEMPKLTFVDRNEESSAYHGSMPSIDYVLLILDLTNGWICEEVRVVTCQSFDPGGDYLSLTAVHDNLSGQYARNDNSSVPKIHVDKPVDGFEQQLPLKLGPEVADKLFDGMPSPPSIELKEENVGADGSGGKSDCFNNLEVFHQTLLKKGTTMLLDKLLVRGPLENGEKHFGGEGETFKLFDMLPVSTLDINMSFPSYAETTELGKCKGENPIILADNDMVFNFDPGGFTLPQSFRTILIHIPTINAGHCFQSFTTIVTDTTEVDDINSNLIHLFEECKYDNLFTVDALFLFDPDIDELFDVNKEQGCCFAIIVDYDHATNGKSVPFSMVVPIFEVGCPYFDEFYTALVVCYICVAVGENKLRGVNAGFRFVVRYELLLILDDPSDTGESIPIVKGTCIPRKMWFALDDRMQAYATIFGSQKRYINGCLLVSSSVSSCLGRHNTGVVSPVTSSATCSQVPQQLMCPMMAYGIMALLKGENSARHMVDGIFIIRGNKGKSLWNSGIITRTKFAVHLYLAKVCSTSSSMDHLAKLIAIMPMSSFTRTITVSPHSGQPFVKLILLGEDNLKHEYILLILSQIHLMSERSSYYLCSWACFDVAMTIFLPNICKIFVWDPGRNIISLYILEDKDIFEKAGKRIIPLNVTWVIMEVIRDVQKHCIIMEWCEMAGYLNTYDVLQMEMEHSSDGLDENLLWTCCWLHCTISMELMEKYSATKEVEFQASNRMAELASQLQMVSINVTKFNGASMDAVIWDPGQDAFYMFRIEDVNEDLFNVMKFCESLHGFMSTGRREVIIHLLLLHTLQSRHKLKQGAAHTIQYVVRLTVHTFIVVVENFVWDPGRCMLIIFSGSENVVVDR